MGDRRLGRRSTRVRRASGRSGSGRSAPTHSQLASQLTGGLSNQLGADPGRAHGVVDHDGVQGPARRDGRLVRDPHLGRAAGLRRRRVLLVRRRSTTGAPTSSRSCSSSRRRHGAARTRRPTTSGTTPRPGSPSRSGWMTPLRDRRHRPRVHQRQVRRPVPRPLAAAPSGREPLRLAELQRAALRQPAGTTSTARSGAALLDRVPQSQSTAPYAGRSGRAGVRLLRPGCPAYDTGRRPDRDREPRAPSSTCSNRRLPRHLDRRAARRDGRRAPRRAEDPDAGPARSRRRTRTANPTAGPTPAAMAADVGDRLHLPQDDREQRDQPRLPEPSRPRCSPTTRSRPRRAAAAPGSTTTPTRGADVDDDDSFTLLDLLLALFAWAIYLAEVITWLVTDAARPDPRRRDVPGPAGHPLDGRRAGVEPATCCPAGRW